MNLGRLNHVGIATPSIEKSLELYRTMFNAEPHGEPFDVPAQGVRVCFVDTPNSQIELIEPLGETSPILKFLEKNPLGGQHHICFEVPEIHAAAFKLELDVGVPIALGCDCGAQSRMPNGENALEIELMVRHGMAPMAAILAATREAARLTRILDYVGTVEPGKAADLIVVDGNPVDEIGRLRTGIQMVVQGGVVRRDDLGLVAS